MADGLWQTAVAAMTLDHTLYSRAAAGDGLWDEALWLLLGAGLATGLSQLMVLFVNRVPARRFALSLLAGALMFGFGVLAWAFAIRVALILVGIPLPPVGTILTMVGLAHAPLLLAPFATVPHLGLMWQKLLDAWVMVAVVAALALGFAVDWRLAAFVGLAGWALVRVGAALMSPLLGRLTGGFQKLAAGSVLAPPAQVIAELERRACPSNLEAERGR
jgi:hypothetical protein